jgi:hypothetical protein
MLYFIEITTYFFVFLYFDGSQNINENNITFGYTKLFDFSDFDLLRLIVFKTTLFKYGSGLSLECCLLVWILLSINKIVLVSLSNKLTKYVTDKT